MIPQPITIDGKTGTVVYLDAKWHPVPVAQATMARVLFDDGSSAFFTVQSPAEKRDYVRDEEGRFAETGKTTFHPLVQRFLERAQGQHRVAHEDYQPVRVTTSPQQTRFVLPDGTRITASSPSTEHGDAAFDALSYEGHTEHSALRKLMEAGVIRYNQGFGGVQMIGPITQAQAELIADDWNIIYHQEVYVDSVQLKDGTPDYEGSRTRKLSPPFTADALRYWVNHPEAQKAEGIGGITRKFDEASHPRGDDGRFVEASAPRIFNRPSEVGQSSNWGETRWAWINKETGKPGGHLLTGEPIPREQIPSKLYHVTTNAPAVESSGVLLGLKDSGGLGGGQAQGVSFTSSREDAVVIQRELRRAVRIARGEAGIEAIKEWAHQDELMAGLPEGALNNAVEFAMYGWREPTAADVWKDWDVERIRRSRVKDALNAYLQIRGDTKDAKGQPIAALKNPILFGDQKDLAKLDVKNIQILDASPEDIPAEALVTTGSDKFLHEVRVYADVPRRRKKLAYDPNQARDPEGTPTGGQFTESGRAGKATSDPTLMEQRTVGVAKVEALIPRAIAQADFSQVPGGWENMSPQTQAKVEKYYKEHAYDIATEEISTMAIDYPHLEKIRADRPALITHAKRLVESWEFQKSIDMETLTFLDPSREYDRTPVIDMNKLRNKAGVEFTHWEQQDLQYSWRKAYAHAIEFEMEKVKDTDAYLAQREALVVADVERRWNQLSEAQKMAQLPEMVAIHELSVEESVAAQASAARPPHEWVTGVEEGEHSEENYARTHAITKQLTKLRFDEIREERGLLEEDQGEEYQPRKILPSEAIIENIWEAWKQKSSEGLGLSLQLAAARELGGHHRMTNAEIAVAEDYARKQGGMDVLQAYVRAQWEVTQMVMDKANQPTVQVYRGLMLEGDAVESTAHALVDEFGKPLAPKDRPTNIVVERKKTVEEGREIEYVSFDYGGATYKVRKDRELTPTTWKAIEDTTKQQMYDAWKHEVDEVKTALAGNAGKDSSTPETFERLPEFTKLNLLFDWRQSGKVPLPPFESTERAIEKRVAEIEILEGTDPHLFTKLPELQLRRAGAQSTTGTREVANDWSGVGIVPTRAKRVVLRVEAPATSVLSLPVYGRNIQEEHETVIVGTKDKWLWDAWYDKAPELGMAPINTVTTVHKSEPLVIDLQAEDRGKPHWMSYVEWHSIAQKFDESKVQREPAGTAEGGQFAETGRAGQATPDPTLAQQAKEGIAKVEKLLPEAVASADYSGSGLSIESWDDVDAITQDEVYQKWTQNAYDDVQVDMSGVEKEIAEELHKDNQEVLDETFKAVERVAANKFPDTAAALSSEFALKKTLDMDTVEYDEEDGGDEDRDSGRVKLNEEALRFKNGDKLSEAERNLVVDIWNNQYELAFEEKLREKYESSAYDEQRSKLEQETVQQQWDDLSDADKFNAMNDMVIHSRMQHRALSAREPDQWVTGVEEGDASDENYARTHAITKELTKLRTDELRAERGLLEQGAVPEFTLHERQKVLDLSVDWVAKAKDGHIVAFGKSEAKVKAEAEQWAVRVASRNAIPTEKLIEDVWDAWKHKSSEGLGLSLQLAAARELNGHHRMTEEEVADAEEWARENGGMGNLQAYVRAQWEVTQMVMGKAKQPTVQVYRGLMLPGEEVEATPRTHADKWGYLVKPPENIKQIEERVSPELDTPDKPPLKVFVAFDFAGEHFVEEKKKVQSKDIREVGIYREYESDEAAVQRRLKKYESDQQNRVNPALLMKLPELALKRAGAQSTTGSRSVANDWGGVGDLPEHPIRVVLRVEAPSTSVLSLPVYGKNIQEEHETVLMGTKDKWLWDAWQNKAPAFETIPLVEKVRKAEQKPLVLDLQAEDRGKPHWMSTVDWAKIQDKKKTP